MQAFGERGTLFRHAGGDVGGLGRHQAFGGEQRAARFFQEAGGEGFGLGGALAGGHYAIHQAEGFRTGGGDRFAEQQQVGGAARADEARDQQGAGGFGHQGEVGERHLQDGVVLGEHKIAVQQHGGANADGAPLHGGDQDAGGGGQRAQEARDGRVLARRRVGHEVHQVVAGAETGAGGGEQHQRGAIGFRRGQGVGHGGIHGDGQRVALDRAVEADASDSTVEGDVNVRGGHMRTLLDVCLMD